MEVVGFVLFLAIVYGVYRYVNKEEDKAGGGKAGDDGPKQKK